MRWILLSAAAKELGVSRHTISRWVKTGRLRHHKQEIVGNVLANKVSYDEVAALASQIRHGRKPRRPRPLPG